MAVRAVSVEATGMTRRVTFGPERVEADDIVRAIIEAGYSARLGGRPT